MIITLIGYRGTGKSSVAQPLAARLGWKAVDADVELEARTGRTIREIFAQDGESEFRRLERQVLVELLKQTRLVLAAGGGAILNGKTRDDLKSAGPVIWLNASAATIEHRLYGDATTADRRPDLTAQGGRSEVELLLTQRQPLYAACASLEIHTDVPNEGAAGVPLPDEIAERIYSWLQAAVPGFSEGEATL